MQIAVCDDIQKELRQIRTAFDTYTKMHPEYHFEIDQYRAALDVLHAVEKGKTYDMAFLDICMPHILGTDVAREMLVKNPTMGVVFLTTSDEYAVEAFAMNATHYLLKPFSQDQFNEALDRGIRKTQKQDVLSLSCVDGVYRVGVHEIMFIESQNHYLTIRLSSGKSLRLRMKLSQMYEDLQKYPEFIRVGVSFIVNLQFVRCVSGDGLVIVNGANIPIPKRSREEVKKIFLDFYRKETMQ